jgi:hypothetical protein
MGFVLLVTSKLAPEFLILVAHGIEFGTKL